MKTVEEYITEAYGISHIDTIIKLSDTISLFGIMQEYANYLATEALQIAANKYDGITIKDGFGCICNVQSAITSVKVYLPEL